MQSARREVTLKRDVLQSMPSVRSYNALVVVVPGVVTNLNDTVTGTAMTQFPIHGGRNNEGRMTIDGLNIGNSVGGNQPPQYVVDIGNSQEVTFTTSRGLGKLERHPHVQQRVRPRRAVALAELGTDVPPGPHDRGAHVLTRV